MHLSLSRRRQRDRNPSEAPSVSGVMVARLDVAQSVRVRIPTQLTISRVLIGRRADSESASVGSNPASGSMPE